MLHCQQYLSSPNVGSANLSKLALRETRFYHRFAKLHVRFRVGYGGGGRAGGGGGGGWDLRNKG